MIFRGICCAVVAAAALAGCAGQTAKPEAPVTQQRYELAVAYTAAQQGNHQASIDLYTKALADTSLTADERAGALVNRGLDYERLGDFQKALADEDAALALKPNWALALANRGTVYAALHQPDKALVDVNAAIAQSPEDADYYSQRARVHLIAHDWASAIADADEALKRKSYLIDPMRYRALANEQLAHLDLALADADRAAALAPREGAVHQLRANLLLQAGRSADAVVEEDAAIALEPDNGNHYWIRAVAKFGLGKWTDAIADYDKTLALDPKGIYAVIWRHLARLAEGQSDTAMLADVAAKESAAKWPMPVLAFLQGKMKPAELLQSAATATGPEETSTTADRACEANYYIGADAFLRHNKTVAIPYLRTAAASCPADFMERAGAVNLLQHPPT